jgi:predicted O-linked N-acetylglucosamine transferase (SPINDLY family)
VNAAATDGDLYQRALVLYRQGDLPAAERLCRDVLAIAPQHPDALHLLGLIANASGRSDLAVGLLRDSLRANPNQPAAAVNLGAVLLQVGQAEAALAQFDSALQLDPRMLLAHYNRANVLQTLGRHSEALAGYDSALALQPQLFEAHNNRGHSLLQLQRPAEALDSFERALQLRPNDPQALTNRAATLHILALAAVSKGDRAEAIPLFEASLASDPNQPATHCNLGNALLDLRRPLEALARFENALRLAPEYLLALYNHGTALFELRRHTEALPSLDRVLQTSPDHVGALVNRGAVLRALGRNEEALVSLERAMSLQPDFKYLPGAVLYLRSLAIADWSHSTEHAQQIRASIMSGQPADVPLSFLAVSDRAAEQLKCSQLFCADQQRSLALAPLWRGERYAHSKVRVGYLSSDFREHAVSYLLAGVLEQHDRSRFEIVGLSLRPEDQSLMGRRVRNAVDRFVDLSPLSDAQAAEQVRALEVDIVVDLIGFTEGARTGVLSRRPAPIQVNYLGFPGTLGAPYMDYILADEFVIPPEQREHYAEQVVYLPDCFQANDSQRAIETSLSRGDCGLPAAGPVLCCFNNTFKLTPQLFAIWMRLLQQVPHSALWLLGDTPFVQSNLQAKAAEHGVDPRRLVFAPRLTYAKHLGRLGLADLFLDTLPFNGGTTASDALWAGVPVLTCPGEAFAARMAGSLLQAIGLPELITHNLVEYEQLALQLLRDPQQLAQLRARLAAHRTTYPLFNTQRFCRHLESAYLHMHDRYQRGMAPATFSIAPHRSGNTIVI